MLSCETEAFPVLTRKLSSQQEAVAFVKFKLLISFSQQPS